MQRKVEKKREIFYNTTPHSVGFCCPALPPDSRGNSSLFSFGIQPHSPSCDSRGADPMMGSKARHWLRPGQSEPRSRPAPKTLPRGGHLAHQEPMRLQEQDRHLAHQM